MSLTPVVVDYKNNNNKANNKNNNEADNKDLVGPSDDDLDKLHKVYN